LTKWLFVATPENWQRCLESRTWGVKDRYKTAKQRMKIGDQILIHLTENKTAGICKIVREYFEDNSKMWHGDEIYRNRIGIEPLKLPPHPIDGKFAYDKYLRATIIAAAEKMNHKEAIVSVKDTGTGIDPEIYPRLFTKFVSKSIAGTGLGLFISKSIVEAHGGKMWSENNADGNGATFYFSLPLSK
jgi:predicted RNA-binding protein